MSGLVGSIWLLVVCPVLFAVLGRLPRNHNGIIEKSCVGALRRLVAFFIDIIYLFLFIVPIITLFVVTLEFLSTGVWRWEFERDVFRLRDVISMILMFISYGGIFYYFKWHFQSDKQTIGQHVMGFQLIADGANPSIGLRFFFCFLVLSWWPFWLITLRRKNGDYLWDRQSHIVARLVEPISKE